MRTARGNKDKIYRAQMILTWSDGVQDRVTLYQGHNLSAAKAQVTSKSGIYDGDDDYYRFSTRKVEKTTITYEISESNLDWSPVTDLSPYHVRRASL